VNPYDWQGHRPQVVVDRPETRKVLADLLRGGGIWVLAGRGMGKSVFLRQIEEAARNLSEITVARISTAPPMLSYETCLRSLANTLGVEENVRDTGHLIALFRQRHGPDRRLVLLFDEFDRYVRAPFDSAQSLAGRDFFNDLENTRKEHRVGILAAGGIGSFVFRDVLGSSFLSRALKVLLPPFESDQLTTLAHPLADRLGGAVPEEVLDLLLLSTGGNPALVTYGLERLWEEGAAEELKLVEIFTDFRRDHSQYLWTVRRSFADEELSGAPQRIWELARRGGGKVSQADLRKACRGDRLLALDYADVADLLRSAGLVRLQGSIHADPVALLPLSTLFNLEGPPAAEGSFPERFFADLSSSLAHLHELGADFYRSAGEGGGKRLVPESTLSGVLAHGFLARGWRVEREAQYGAGRTDLKLRHGESSELAVIEVKIWPRNDARQVQRQVESYWSTGVAAGAVVMLSDQELPSWPEDYHRDCLETPGREIEEIGTGDSPIRARFVCRSKTADGLAARIDHFLLRIPRR